MRHSLPSLGLRSLMLIIGLFLSGTLLSQGKILAQEKSQQTAQQQHIRLKTGAQQDNYRTPGVVGMDLLIQKRAHPRIKQVMPGLPAAKAGLVPGDRILKIDTTPTFGKSLRQIDRLISDTPGAPVRFTIRRKDKTLTYTLWVEAISALSWEAQAYYKQPRTFLKADNI